MKNLCKMLFISFTVGILTLLSACNTIHGAGQDISATGQGISNAAATVKNS